MNKYQLFWIVPFCFVLGMLSYSLLSLQVNEEQGNAIAQSIMVLAAYESAGSECMDFETRMCVVQGKNRKYLEILETVYGE